MDLPESSPGPNPAWLGVFAAASFAALVATSFASGYHLVGHRPRALAEPPAGETSPASASDGDVQAVEVRSALVRKHAHHEKAVVRDAPNGGEVVDQLDPDHRVSVVGRQGDWYRIRYEHAGEPREGWTHEVNLVLD